MFRFAAPKGKEVELRRHYLLPKGGKETMKFKKNNRIQEAAAFVFVSIIAMFIMEDQIVALIESVTLLVITAIVVVCAIAAIFDGYARKLVFKSLKAIPRLLAASFRKMFGRKV